jgi:hypothetical protein
VAAGRSLFIGATVAVGWPRAINQSVYLPWGKEPWMRVTLVLVLVSPAGPMLCCVSVSNSIVGVGVHLLLARAALSTPWFIHSSL